MSPVDVEIRPLAQHEVDVLQQHIPRPQGMHQSRLALQHRGQAVYLVAWLGNVPAGHVLLEWAGTAREPMVSYLRRCPHLSDLFVGADHRSGGIGSCLMDAAEGLIRQGGYARVGLGVAIDNTRARSLYERRGYRDAGLGLYSIRWIYVDEHRQEQPREEVCVYLIKSLA